MAGKKGANIEQETELMTATHVPLENFLEPVAVDPMQELVFCKHDGKNLDWPGEFHWSANSRMIRMAVDQVIQIPRWAFNLGLKYPKSPLVELNPQEGSIEYEESQAQIQEAAVKKMADQLEEQKKKLDEARKKATASRAKIGKDLLS